MTTEVAELVLPRFNPAEKCHDKPSQHHVEAEHVAVNEHGVPMRFRVEANWLRTRWYVSAIRAPNSTLPTRGSNGLETDSRQEAEAWIRAVSAGRVRVAQAEVPAAKVEDTRRARMTVVHSTSTPSTLSLRGPGEPGTGQRAFYHKLAAESLGAEL